MKMENLWSLLEPIEDSKEQLIKDYKSGITPNLPYFVVGQEEIKEKISTYLTEIDSNYFHRNLLVSDYGNGKTNILRYLELYFHQNNYENVQYIYEPANIDKPNVFLILLELLEHLSLNTLIKSILNSKKNTDFISQLSGSATHIKEYIQCLFSNDNTTEETKELILMGTGRHYTKNYYNSYGIDQLTDTHRKEVLILFLNILSENNHYIVFSIDEIEKIYEKSKARFRLFLTSFRELIDVSNKINGHYFIGAMVTSLTHFAYALDENPAFHTRINKDILNVEFLTLREEKEDLLKNILQMLNKTIDPSKFSRIISTIETKFNKENPIRNNRLMISEIFTQLNDTKIYKDLDSILAKKELNYEFEDLKDELEVSGTFKNIKGKFTDGLRNYFEIKDVNLQKTKIDNLFLQKRTSLYQYFIFTQQQLDDNIDYLKALVAEKNSLTIYFNSEEHKINHNDFKEVELINYDAKTLLTLFILLEENLNYQDDIIEVIEHYTQGTL